MERIEELLKGILKGRITVVGVGNTEKGDDGVGHILADRIKGKLDAFVICAGPTPENFLRPIRDSRPETILVIDASELGAEAGDAKLLTKEDIPLYGLSTHNSSLALFFEFLESDTGASVYLLAIQPGDTGMRKGFSNAVKTRCDELEQTLLRILPNKEIH
ncbi:MAG: hydrogenase maturation protease [Candidatus Omnitrophica bacterium]|nr:hydrogenase maturation protease [Candidatus Omnitrophota bacterium]